MPKRADTVLNEKTAKAIHPPASGYVEQFDGRIPGLALRVYATGARSWTLHFRTLTGRKRSIHLGPYGIPPALPVEAARRKAEAVRVNVHEGRDPLFDREALKAHAKTLERDTIGALVAEYEKTAAGKQRAWPEARRILKKYILPHWADRPVKAITRRDVVELVSRNAAKAPVQANRIHGRVSALLTFAVKIGWIDANPAHGIDKPGGEEASRDRVLSDDELRALWKALGETTATADDGKPLPRLGATMNDLFRTLLLTGQRLGETARAKWEHIDLDAEVWTIPASEAKNGREHAVPLTPQVQAILTRRRDADPEAAYVFSNTPGAHVYDRAKKAAARLSEGLPFAFRAHDLRRTVATGIVRAGIPREWADAVLSHAPAGASAVSRVYNRHSYLPEKRSALEAWAGLLEQIVADAVPKTDARTRGRDEGRQEERTRMLAMLAELRRLAERHGAE